MIELFYWIATVLAWLHLGVALISLARHRAPESIHDRTTLPNVAVIIPTCNEERTISSTLLAWCRCSPKPSRIIVVDDGSTDGTTVVVTALKKEIPTLSLVCKSHAGKARALNFALRQVDTDLVIVSDADTTPGPDIITHLLAPFVDPAVVAVSANRRTLAPRLLRWLFDLEHVAGANLTRNIGNLWHCQTGMSGALSAFRRLPLLAIGGYPENELSEDTAVTLRIQEVGDVVYVPSALVYTASPMAPKAALEQHRRWLIGALQAIVPYGVSSLRQRGRLSFGLVYFVVFRLLLPMMAPFTDYFIITSLIAQQWSEALRAMAMYLVPSTLIGVIAVFLDRYPRTMLILLPIAQAIVRQYSMFLVLYVSLRTAVRAPLRWH